LIPLFIFYSLFHALLLFRQYQQFKKLQQATASVKGLGDV
jgi:hypothetical protein